jgi:hypothetical protein
MHCALLSLEVEQTMPEGLPLRGNVPKNVPKKVCRPASKKVAISSVSG